MTSVSALPLLAYKVGPNLFDLSSNLHQVSMRDQQHRAVALAESLVAGKQCKSGDHVLIVGAGVAGIVAGMALASNGISVQIVDSSANAPFALQRGVTTRRVGPYMYEWPLSVYASQEMPPPNGGVLAPWLNGKSVMLPFPAVGPANPSHLVASCWDQALHKAIISSGNLLRLQVGIAQEGTNASVKRWLQSERASGSKRCEVEVHGGTPWGASAPPLRDLKPRFVILAAGMGTETSTLQDGKRNLLLEGEPFWKDDKIRETSCGLAEKPRVVVIGGGDGALQDALRAVTIDDHPLETWDRLRQVETGGQLEQALANIQAMEAQHALTLIWTVADSHGTKALDLAYQSLAEGLAKNLALRMAVRKSLRKDVVQVSLCVKDDHFSKSYALNRFLVHLVEQCVKRDGTFKGRAKLYVHRGVEVTGVDKTNDPQRLTLSDGQKLKADIVIVRFGADVSGLPGQWLGLTKKDTENRQELARVPLPLYLPPSK